MRPARFLAYFIGLISSLWKQDMIMDSCALLIFRFTPEVYSTEYTYMLLADPPTLSAFYFYHIKLFDCSLR